MRGGAVRADPPPPPVGVGERQLGQFGRSIWVSGEQMRVPAQCGDPYRREVIERMLVFLAHPHPPPHRRGCRRPGQPAGTE
jgi:hypothetical protein